MSLHDKCVTRAVGIGIVLQHAVARSGKILEEHGLPHDLSFARIAEPCGAYPVDGLTKNALWYQDATRVSTARAWIAGDGIVYVAMSANAAKNGVDTDDCLLLTSLSNIYGPAVAPARTPDSAAENSASNSAAGSDAAAASPDQPENYFRFSIRCRVSFLRPERELRPGLLS